MLRRTSWRAQSADDSPRTRWRCTGSNGLVIGEAGQARTGMALDGAVVPFAVRDQEGPRRPESVSRARAGAGSNRGMAVSVSGVWCRAGLDAPSQSLRVRRQPEVLDNPTLRRLRHTESLKTLPCLPACLPASSLYPRRAPREDAQLTPLHSTLHAAPTRSARPRPDSRCPRLHIRLPALRLQPSRAP
ncbi:hypothetical protein BU26DRAFT_159638 [Trematosphaeria pertusa]|uniref:Uncharacterized protein n=1 Tax=Trematosphaeria pertusa TaxID=390896 RepID=A0A6A6HWI1_9PLEO|nr:uncharacterized protein BU26DRAFT_159638 [Trematosphaeria pertusa]KAF2242371.1 hypothetical protein BU26DRAFT_159638 [Trematosphaeria pertusa]